MGPLSHQFSNSTKPDDAQRLFGQLHTLPATALPSPGFQSGMGLWDIAGTGQEQSHGVFGSRDDIALRGIDHHDTAIGGRFNIDIVQSDSSSAHDDQVLSRIEHLGGDLCGRADDERLSTDQG